MTVPVRLVPNMAVLATAASVAACAQPSTSRAETPQTSAAAGRSSGDEAGPDVALEARETRAAGPLRTAEAPAPLAEPAARSLAAEGLTWAPEDGRTLIGYYHKIRLSREQERLKVEALSALPAPCCSRYSLATCCCRCNMAKAAWGLAAWLIVEKGFGLDQVRQAETDWLKRVNPSGFSGNACFNGGCSRPMHDDGCGGMKDDAIAS